MRCSIRHGYPAGAFRLPRPGSPLAATSQSDDAAHPHIRTKLEKEFNQLVECVDRSVAANGAIQLRTDGHRGAVRGVSTSVRGSAAAIATSTVEALSREAVPGRRKHAEGGYVPTALEILGVPAPAQRRILRPLRSSLRAEAPARVFEVARALLETRVHEARQIAYELLGNRNDVVRGLDRGTVEELGAGNDNWASVDSFGVYVVGPAWRDGKVTDADVRAWAHSPDRWWRRTALVATVALNVPARGGCGDAPRTLSICEILADDTEPMVVKAESWALRALVAVDATAVRAFLDRRADELPALVRREVRNKLETGLKSGRKR